jgi:hypothetical protein
MFILLLLQVSVGTLIAFTISAVIVLIVRYIPPVEVPWPHSRQEPIDSESMECGWSHLETNENDTYRKPLIVKEDVSIDYPLIAKYLAIEKCELRFSFLSIQRF